MDKDILELSDRFSETIRGEKYKHKIKSNNINCLFPSFITLSSSSLSFENVNWAEIGRCLEFGIRV